MNVIPRLLLFGAATLAAGVLAAEAPADFKVSKFTFTRPSAWGWVEPTSSMRKAQLSVPNPERGETGEIIFFHFGPGDGGGTKANVERWFSQFAEPRDKIHPKSEETTVGSHKVTYVQAEGTYKSGIPGAPSTPKPGFALLGAIVEDAQGSVFVRMTGPKPLVQSSAAEFKRMIESGLK